MSVFQQEALKKLKEIASSTPATQIYVVELESIPFKEITQEIKEILEKFTSLQYLALNNCELENLNNFPDLKSLIRLDLISNKLKGSHLSSILSSKYLQTLFLCANRIDSVEELGSLKKLSNLLQIDVIANDLTHLPEYHKKLFELLPNVKVVDSVNREGERTTDVVSESLKRVRPDLFVKGKSNDGISAGIPLNNIKIAKPAQPISLSVPQKPAKISFIKGKPGKTAKNIGKTGKSVGKIARKAAKSEKSGLVFKSSRIARKLRNGKMFERISKKTPIFLTAVLEYVCAEILEVAKDAVVGEKKKRILPKHIKIGIKNDQDLHDFFGNMIIPEAGNS